MRNVAIRGGRRGAWKVTRIAAGLGLGLVIAAASVPPAAADEHRPEQQQHRSQQYHQGHPGERHNDRDGRGYGPRGYYVPPPVVYAPAPVYYAPPVSPGINLVIPFSFR